MTITNSSIASQIIKHNSYDVGTLHFFNHMAVVEFDEGVHVDLFSARQIINDLMTYFGNSRPFGLIANRVHSYSVSLLEIVEIKSIFPNLVSYGVVSHNEAGRMNAKIENGFCSEKNISFDNLYEAMDSVYSDVKQRITSSLN